jgi:hypothetical protein
MVAPLAVVLFVEITNRLVEVVGALALVVSVAVYFAQEPVIEGIVAVAQTVPVVDSKSTVSGPVKPGLALA